ncbi:bifunctional 2-polyprenyl-6-hydroxyphenol methylase/3-demethylubiquinol 3-O-methyltransferase UbiG [Brevundimonas sp. PAMC22021]|uniref:class I SAM-dependent methyltransferase n=1 Tax=Brevundimonas sp. PAMC22021 TaxID=2861285 RepID=UPI001C633A78|nr:class I SAM-dependent methyltransferase [Brevundimonas sp. PAMC22021]QYF87697.1 class I SAM-dependent methyltransferase [Brevundimonas sp. PAMC22021]
MSKPAFNFADADFVARYVEKGPRAFMPGQPGVLQMAGVLLGERVPDDGHVLVVGAGGGMDTQALAKAGPGWRFTGVDPAAKMLDLARHILGDETMRRVELIEGGVEAAPEGPFDGATLILVLGILPDDGSKLETLKQIRRRIKPGAPFVLVDRCDSADSPLFDRNMDRYVAFAAANGVDAETLKNARASHRGNPGLVTAARDETLLTEAGFADIEHFYHAMNWHGWVAYA